MIVDPTAESCCTEVHSREVSTVPCTPSPVPKDSHFQLCVHSALHLLFQGKEEGQDEGREKGKSKGRRRAEGKGKQEQKGNRIEMGRKAKSVRALQAS